MDADTRGSGVDGAGAAGEPLSPYHAARWARDRHVDELENKIRYLRALVFILVAVCAIAVHGAVTLARQSRIVPYIVEVDRLGQPLAYGRVENMPAPDERLIRGELARFVDAMRTVHTDPVAQNKLIDRGYAFTRAAARTYVDAYFGAASNNPHLLSRELIRLVSVRSVRRVAGSDEHVGSAVGGIRGSDSRRAGDGAPLAGHAADGRDSAGGRAGAVRQPARPLRDRSELDAAERRRTRKP